MQHYYDGLEIRPSALREQQQLDQLNHLLTHVGQYCAGYSSAYRQRRLQDLGELTSLPLLNASELFAAQQAHPPFAGLTYRPASQALRVFACPGQLAIPEYAGADWWGRHAPCSLPVSRPGRYCSTATTTTSAPPPSSSTTAPASWVHPWCPVAPRYRAPAGGAAAL